MDSNDYKKYLKYKKKYLDLKAYQKELAIKNEGGNIVGCGDYYNKDKDGNLKFCYHFGSFNAMTLFLRNIRGGDTSTEIKYASYNNTILDEIIKNNFEISKVPELVKILLKLRLTEAKLLELILSKQQVEDYELILQNKYPSTGSNANRALQAALQNLISPNILTSLKKILYIEDDSIDRSDINIWDAYSDLLSFYCCMTDSKIVNPGNKMGTFVVNKLEAMQLPVSLVFLELLAKRIYNKDGILLNSQNIIEDIYKGSGASAVDKPSDIVKTAYNNTRNFTLEDFLNRDNNPNGILPPSVLLLLSMKLNPNNNTNGWNKTIKGWINYVGIHCTNTLSQKEIIEQYEILFREEENLSNQSTDNLSTLLQSKKQELIKIQEEMKTLELTYSNRRTDGKTIQQKCSIKKAEGVKNTVKAMFSKLKFKVSKSDDKENSLCGQYYQIQNKKHFIEDEIQEILTKMSLAVTNREPSILGNIATNLKALLSGTTQLKKDVCDSGNSISWRSFNDILKRLHTFATIDLSRFDSVKHLIIQSVIAFATFLPFDLKELLYYVLHTADKRKPRFEQLYETYRLEIYINFISHDNDNYYLRKTGDAPYDPNKPNDMKITSPLWPPTSLFEAIKQSTMPSEKISIFLTFKENIKRIFSGNTVVRENIV